MKKSGLVLLLILISLTLTGCFNIKKSPFYDSEWVMQNYDNNKRLYYHHLVLKPDYTAKLRVTYEDFTSVIEWKGTYKIDSKKIKFNFTECELLKEGKLTGAYESQKLIKFYSGEYYYSLGLLENSGNEEDVKKNIVLS